CARARYYHDSGYHWYFDIW
nr:immunoglobulin heavy chain junction region [Macaca mulatta]MOX62164.1 immunoglobulin heavy chain junction region [Macaca mulatta]MOX64301.1 immunoglobulin heavy chain junction region [Macaca mulatta]MOX65032.1 immunoglobulin heavy chain junction region [Macaca mulatta]MOX66632.1 immunoglobulin heavy chain junction region [Macaca mulatta]